MPNLDPYAIFGLEKTASVAEIRQTYKRLRVALHPDQVSKKGGSIEEKVAAATAFQNLQSAYLILSDPEKRQAYDLETNQSDILNAMTASHDQHRPSIMWARLKNMYEELYQLHPLEEINADKRATVLNKSIPLTNNHFSSLCYQHFYALTKQNEQGENIDEPFSDVFALIEEKQRRFDDALFIEADLNLTPELALDWLLNFLKGKYYGVNLVQIQRILADGINKKTPAIGLYQAILTFISIKNLKSNYKEALSAIHALHDAALTQYKAIERESALLKQIKEKAQEEYQEQMTLVQSAQTLLNIKTKHYEDKRDKALHLKEELSAVEKEIIENKTMVNSSKMTFVDQETQFERLENKRYNIQQTLEAIEAQYHIAKTAMDTACDALAEQLDLIPALETRVNELKTQQIDREKKKFNACFLNLIESKYYKLTLASMVSCYWNDATPVVTPQIFTQVASRFSCIPLALRNQCTAIGQALLYADDHIKELSQELTVEQYCEHADFFYDLYTTLPVLAVKINAMIMAGLCWQMAARKADIPSHQMALEALSLRMHQMTIKQATKLPASYALYVMIHVPKYLSELRYDQNTMEMSDYLKLTANRHSRHERIPPTQYDFYAVHNGSPLESMEGAMDRAFYLMSYFPIFSELTHALDQMPRQRCYTELQALVLERFKNKQQIQAEEDTLQADDAELFYYMYQAALQSNTIPEAELNHLRLRTMQLLLEQSNTSLMELNQLMNAPFVSMPQNNDGFWTTGPLNYPDDPDSLDLIIYKSFNGYSLNSKTGEILFSVTRWMPDDDPSERLFMHADLQDLIKGGVSGAIFSLDANSVYRQYDPLQVVRMSQNIKNTEYSKCAFATDYIMKMASQGTEVKARPPYNIRPIQSLFDGLNESIQKDLLVCNEETPSSECSKSQATRFWIQMGAIPRLEKERGYNSIVHYGDPEVSIKKQLLTIDAHGNLVDAPIDLEDQSKEARFAAAFTQHYDKIAKKLPVFNQLKAFYAISGAIKELQEKRSRNQRLLESAQEKLADSAFWLEEKNKERNKWTTMNWDVYLAEHIAELTQRFNDDAHWERKIEDTVNSLENQRKAVNHVGGKEYQKLVDKLTEEHRSLAERMYTQYPRLRWSATNPGFMTYIKDLLSEKLGILTNDVDSHLSPKEKEAVLQGIKTNLKKQLLQLYASLKPVMGEKPYQTAKMKLSQGDVMPMAAMLAAYAVTNTLVNDGLSAEKNPVLETVKQDLVTVLKSKWLTKLSNESIQILDKSSTKMVYTITDPIFIAVYNTTRSQIRNQLIEANRAGIPNFSQLESHYLKQIDDHLDRDFSKQSQLATFNGEIKKKYEEKKLAWFSEMMSESPHIQSLSPKAREPFYAAIDALFDGDSRAIALLIQDAIFQDLITAIKTNTPKSADAQALWEMFVAKEIKTQTNILANQIKTNQCLEYDHLKPFFGERPFEEAINHYVQGEPSLLIEGQVADAIEQKRNEVAGDLYATARTKVDAERRALENNIPDIAQKQVDQIKAVITHHLEAQLDAIIDGSKQALRERINDCHRLEAGFTRIGLGKGEEPNATSNTDLRVPAIFSKRHDTYVYGGVNAMPSFKAVDELNKAASQLTFVSSMGGEWSIRNARDTLNDVSRQANSSNISVSIAMRSLEQSIRFAEWSLFTWRAAAAGVQFAAEITRNNAAHNTTPIFTATAGSNVPNAPKNPGPTPDFSYATASESSRKVPTHEQVPTRNTTKAPQHPMHTDFTRQGDVRASDPVVLPKTDPSSNQNKPTENIKVESSSSVPANAFMNYGRAVVRGAKQWGSDLAELGQSAIRTVVDTAMIAAPHPMGLSATHEEMAEWRAQPFYQNAQQRMEGRVRTVSHVARSVVSFTTDAAILSSHPLGHFATSIEMAEWHEGMRHLPIHQNASRRMNERLNQVEEGVHSFLEKSGPERVEGIVRWSLHLFDPMIGTKVMETATRFKIPTPSRKNINKGYDPSTDKGPVLHAVRRDDRWSCDAPPGHSAPQLTVPKQIVYRESTPVVQQAARHPQAPIVPISAPAPSVGKAPIVEPTLRTPIIDINPSQIRSSVFDPTPTIPMVDPAPFPGASSVQMLSTPPQKLIVLVPQKSNVNAVSHVYLDVVLDPTIAKAEGSYIIPQFGIAPERYHSPECQALLQPWKSAESQSFYKKQHAVTERRRRKYERYISDVEKDAWSEFKSITCEFSKQEKDDAKKLFLGVLRYRENVETALYAKELEYINCGEQTATAFVDELIRVKNERPSIHNQKIHIISLRSRKDDHAFIVSGSTTLEEACVNRGDAVAEILSSMDGMVIDYWNNPAAGGVRLSAEIAREQFIMYGPKVAAVLNQMFVEEYFTEEMHLQIQSMPASPELKSLLTKCAGPSLDEIQEKFSQFDQRHTRVQRMEPDHLPSPSSKPDSSYQHLLANAPIFHNVFAATDGQIFNTPPVVRLYSMDEIKACQARTRFLYAVTIENDLLVAPYYLEQERWTGRNFLKHDELTSGSPVYAAGELLVEKGEILEINERTGHYLVCGEHLATLVETRFNQVGGDATGKFIFKHSLDIAHGERKPIITYPAPKESAVATVDEPLFPPGSVGAAKSWSIKSRMSERGLPNEGRVRYVPPEGYDPIAPLPRGNHKGYIDRFGNEWVKGPSRTKGEDFEWDVRLSRVGESHFKNLEAQFGSFVRKHNDGPYINVSPLGHITH